MNGILTLAFATLNLTKLLSCLLQFVALQLGVCVVGSPRAVVVPHDDTVHVWVSALL